LKPLSDSEQHKQNLPIALALRVAHHAGYNKTLDARLVRAGGLGMQ